MKIEKEKKNPGKENRTMVKQRHEAKRGSYYRETRPTMVIEDKRRKNRDQEAKQEIRESE